MRTPTNTRTALAMTGAMAALLVGGTAMPAQAAPDKQQAQSSQGRKSQENNRASSNKDGKGHNDRWQAQADPDGQENGGIDQPGGDGGVDPKGYDGNNGSGNDPDCEDDNRGKGVPGHCKVKPAQTAATEEPEDKGAVTPPTPSTTTETGDESEGPAKQAPVREQVLGIEGSAPAPTATATATPTTSATPLASAPRNLATGESVESASSLPETGADAAMLAMLLGGLTAAGAGTVIVRRRATES